MASMAVVVFVKRAKSPRVRKQVTPFWLDVAILIVIFALIVLVVTQLFQLPGVSTLTAVGFAVTAFGPWFSLASRALEVAWIDTMALVVGTVGILLAAMPYICDGISAFIG